MKRVFFAAFCILALCSLFLLTNTGTVKTQYPGYETLNPSTTSPPVLDGNWTTDTEWSDIAYEDTISANAVFRNCYAMADDGQGGFLVYEYFLIEIFDDDTNDTADYCQVIYDGDDTADGGSAPQSDNLRFDVVGHTEDGMAAYQGTGTGWGGISQTADQFQMANSISASPTNSTPHWITEIRIEKTTQHAGVGIAIDPWIRVAVYDDSNASAGAQAWPPGDQDVPDEYGLDTSAPAVPEGFTFGVVVLLSSVAGIVAFCLRKRSRIDKCSSGKLGK